MNQSLRPERIAVMQARMAEIDRAANSFRNILRESNDEEHQAFFAPVLHRIGLIVANEREGITAHLADDLSVARSAVRRLSLPDIDPYLNEPTQALKLLRGERGNLVEALDNALDAAKALGLEPGLTEFGELRVPRQAFAEQLIRLDERLRVVQDAVADIRVAAINADTTQASGDISHVELVNIHVQSLAVEVNAARFETHIGNNPGIPEQTDLAALTRSIEAMRDLTIDLNETVEGLKGWIAASVKTAGSALAKAVERSWRGMRTVVSMVRRRLVGHPMHVPQYGSTPPLDFDAGMVHQLILIGKAPPPNWRPWITRLEFQRTSLHNLMPLLGLTNLETLDLASTLVGDLSALSELFRLRTLILDRSPVGDLGPLWRLDRLERLDASSTRIRDLTPLWALTGLQVLTLSSTLIYDLSALEGHRSLRTLTLSSTKVSDLGPLSNITSLETLTLSSTQVRDLTPLSSLTKLRTLTLNNTLVRDLGPYVDGPPCQLPIEARSHVTQSCLACAAARTSTRQAHGPRQACLRLSQDQRLRRLLWPTSLSG